MRNGGGLLTEEVDYSSYKMYARLIIPSHDRSSDAKVAFKVKPTAPLYRRI